MKLDIKSIIADNKSGSFTITTNLLKHFQEYISEKEKTNDSVDQMFEEMQTAAKTMIKYQSNMVLLRKTSYSIVAYFKRLLKTSKDRKELFTALKSKIETTLEDVNNDIESIAANGAKIIANFNKILTYSNSTVVQYLLHKADQQKRKFEVFCLKSDPPGEGVSFAEYLAKKGIKTSIIADTQAGVMMNEMNLVIVGADRLYEDGFVNKSGTLALCLLAKYYNIPVYLAAETSKILKESERSVKQSERSPQEIYDGDEEINVVNNYYEKIPINLIHKVICEEGVFETPEFLSWYLGD